MKHGEVIVCPMCGSESLDSYIDSENFDYSGGCYECGYTFYTIQDRLSLQEVNELREDAGLEPLTELRKQVIK